MNFDRLKKLAGIQIDETAKLKLVENKKSKKEDDVYVLYIGEKGSDKMGIQFSGTKQECKDEWIDSWKDSREEGVKYYHKIVKWQDDLPTTVVNEGHYAYDVYLKGKLIDTVFQSHKDDPEDVKKSLVNHDGYDSEIEVELAEAYQRKTEDEWTLWGNYGQGWEILTTEATFREIRERRKEYIQNEGGSYKITTKRVKKQVNESDEERAETLKNHISNTEDKQRTLSKDSSLYKDLESAKKRWIAELESIENLHESEKVLDPFVVDSHSKISSNKTDYDKEFKIKVPVKVKNAVNTRISQIKQSIDDYDEKGYNDHSVKLQAIENLEKIMNDLDKGDLEGFKQAQICYTSLMSPLTNLFPSELVTYLHTSIEKVKYLN